ncbi:MAG: diaminopimelate epimerase, partial [Clostridia bacterium]|nr:diaminopimelate epimerase [Clostridia bacterium]
AAEDRERFDVLLEKLSIKRPIGHTVMTCQEALDIASKIGYPVLMRPSYVLGGQNMIIAFNEEDIREYMAIILAQNITNPVLIDKYLMGTELEVDAICDGEDILIPGIMEHIERAGIHSGDSIAVYPAQNVADDMRDRIIACTQLLSAGLHVTGLVNIQYLIYQNELYVIEVNPRSSRTVPYISKVTGVPMVDLAVETMLGKKLRDLGYGTGLYKTPPYVAVKVPVFSFEKLINVDTHLGPEMKSTGEVLGLAGSFEEALYKGLIGAGYSLKKHGGVFITVRDSDKAEIFEVAKKFHDMGFSIYATAGTSAILTGAGIPTKQVSKIHETGIGALELLESGKIQYVISTSAKGRIPTRDSVKIRRKAVERNIPCLTSLDTANAVADSLKSRYSEISTELVNINEMRTERQKLHFMKMESTGNDYIYFDCFTQKIDNPEGLAVRFSDRHYGIGGDGIVLIAPSEVANAKMRMFNTDGSEGRMCGNAIRCVAKYLYESGMVRCDTITIETLSGVKAIRVYRHDGEVLSAKVDMGKAELAPGMIPVKLPGEEIVGRSIEIGGEAYSITCVSMGNPHCVVFSENVDGLPIEKIGPVIENADIFPERVNVEFVKVVDGNTLRMRVWERGTGETWACGTGACAAAVAAVENGYCNKEQDIKVKLRGGDLMVRYTDNTVFMTGGTSLVYSGDVII